MKKRPDLKKRLDDLRGEPAAPVEVTLRLEASLYRLLETLAAGEGLALEAYLVQALADHAERAPDDRDE